MCSCFEYYSIFVQPVNQMGMTMMMLKKLLTAHDSNISVSVLVYLRWNSSLLNTPSSQSDQGKAKLIFWRIWRHLLNLLPCSLNSSDAADFVIAMEMQWKNISMKNIANVHCKVKPVYRV